MDEFSLFQLTAFVHQLHHGLACAIMCEMVNYLIPDLTNTQVGVGSRPYQPIPRTASKRLRKAHSTVTVPGSQDKLFRGPEASKNSLLYNSKFHFRNFERHKIILSYPLMCGSYCPPQVVYFFHRIKLSLNFLPYPRSLLFHLWSLML